MKKIDLFTWNILGNTLFHGSDFTWESRKGAVCKFIASHIDEGKNQTFCFQEAKKKQCEDIRALFNPEKYDVYFNRQSCLLSILSKSLDGAACTPIRGNLGHRMLALDVQDMRIINVHFPMELDERKACTKMIVDSVVGKSPDKVVVCGDMNAFLNDGGPATIGDMIKVGFYDVLLVTEEGKRTGCTFEAYPNDGFYGKRSVYPLDHILVYGIACKQAIVHHVRTHEVNGKKWSASDHFALIAKAIV